MSIQPQTPEKDSRLRDLRRRKGESDEAFAKRFDLNPDELRRWKEIQRGLT